jgi:polysaccharide biosynthesis/export protein
MRGARAQIACLLAGFFVSGSMQTSSPVAMGPSAVAIAGGFLPRARRDSVTLAHSASRTVVPLGTAIGPGGTVLVSERWF